jgi:hypothetical protein
VFVDLRCGPEIDEPVEDVGDVGLRLDVVELARSSQGLNAMTSGLLFSWRTRRRSSALAPLIVFSIT